VIEWLVDLLLLVAPPPRKSVVDVRFDGDMLTVVVERPPRLWARWLGEPVERTVYHGTTGTPRLWVVRDASGWEHVNRWTAAWLDGAAQQRLEP